MARPIALSALFAAGLCAGVGARSVAAQPAASDPLALGLRIDGEPAEVDAGAVRDAVAADLDVPVAEASGRQPALGLVTVTLERNAARLVYRRTDGVSTERTLTLPPEPAARVELLAFMVTNLVRDQTSEALAQMSRRSAAPAATARRDAPAPATGPDEFPVSGGLAPPLLIDRLRGEHHVVGAGLYLVMGVQDGSQVVSISGAADYQRRFATGVQIAGAAAITSRLDGLQIAGATSIAGAAHGVQIAGATSLASSIDGIQIAGAVSGAEDVHGLQIAPLNLARHLHGVQFGVFNVSDGDDDAVPIGLFNYARHGRTELEGSIDSSEMSTLLFRHGPPHVQNVWGVGQLLDHDRRFIGVGLGAHHALDGVGLDLDAMLWNELAWGSHDFALLNQLRATIAVPVGPIDLIGGAIANVYVDDGHGFFADLHPHGDRVYRSGTTMVALWPSGFVGLRLRT